LRRRSFFATETSIFGSESWYPRLSVFDADQIFSEFPRPDLHSDEPFNFRNEGGELGRAYVRTYWIPMPAKKVFDPPASLRVLFVHGDHMAA
jgi:hypothetical protein